MAQRNDFIESRKSWPDRQTDRQGKGKRSSHAMPDKLCHFSAVATLRLATLCGKVASRQLGATFDSPWQTDAANYVAC